MKSLRPILMACLAASWGALAHAQSSVWQIEQVQQATANDCSIEVDAQSVPHIGYRSHHIDTNLKYAQRGMWGWSIEDVDLGAATGLDVSLRLDGSQQPHIAYSDPNAPAVKLADRFGTSWTLQAVASVLGSRTSLALDSSSRPVIAYVNHNDNSTMYLASFRNGQWTITKLTNNSVADLSLALNFLGRPRIAYIDSTAGTLKYAQFNGTSWLFETVETVSVQNYGAAVSIALHPTDGHPVVAYDAGDQVRLAERIGGVWTTQAVDGDASATASYVSLRVDGGGDVHVAYSLRKTGSGILHADLRYARRVTGLTNWSKETVDGAYSILGVSLAVDAESDAHIAYVWDDALMLLKYATNQN